MIFTHSVTVREPGTRTLAGGDAVDDWSTEAVTETTIDGVSVQPTSTTETITSAEDTVTDTREVYTKPGEPVTVSERARIVYEGRTYRVVGRVATYNDPITGQPHHTRWTMTRNAGAQ